MLKLYSPDAMFGLYSYQRTVVTPFVCFPFPFGLSRRRITFLIHSLSQVPFILPCKSYLFAVSVSLLFTDRSIYPLFTPVHATGCFFTCKGTANERRFKYRFATLMKFDGNFPKSQITAFHKISPAVPCPPFLCLPSG